MQVGSEGECISLTKFVMLIKCIALTLIHILRWNFSNHETMCFSEKEVKINMSPEKCKGMTFLRAKE